MSEKRKITTPGRYLDGEHWYVVQFTMDNKFGGPLQPWQLEDEHGANGKDRTFKLRDSCHAPWSDGHIYEAIIVYESGREDCLKFLELMNKVKPQKKKAVLNKQIISGKEQTKRKNDDVNNDHDGSVNIVKEKKKAVLNKQIISGKEQTKRKNDDVNNDHDGSVNIVKEKKKALQLELKKKKEAATATAQDMAASLFRKFKSSDTPLSKESRHLAPNNGPHVQATNKGPDTSNGQHEEADENGHHKQATSNEQANDNGAHEQTPISNGHQLLMTNDEQLWARNVGPHHQVNNNSGLQLQMPNCVPHPMATNHVQQQHTSMSSYVPQPQLSNYGPYQSFHWSSQQQQQPQYEPQQQQPTCSESYMGWHAPDTNTHPRSSTPLSTFMKSMDVLNESAVDTECPNTEDSHCYSCTKKDREIDELKTQLRDLQRTADNMNLSLNSSTTSSHHDRSRLNIGKADYIIIEDEIDVPAEYQLLAKGAKVAVRSVWLHQALASVRKTKKRSRTENATACVIVKRLTDAFYTLEELCVPGGSKNFQGTPIYEALKLYTQQHLKVKDAYFRDWWNQKMAWARRTLKDINKNLK